MINVDSMTQWRLERGIQALQMSVAPSVELSQWRLVQAEALQPNEVYDIGIQAWQFSLTGIAHVKGEQATIYLDTRSLWLLMDIALNARFDAHEKKWPHAIGM